MGYWYPDYIHILRIDPDRWGDVRRLCVGWGGGGWGVGARDTLRVRLVGGREGHGVDAARPPPCPLPPVGQHATVPSARLMPSVCVQGGQAQPGQPCGWRPRRPRWAGLGACCACCAAAPPACLSCRPPMPLLLFADATWVMVQGDGKGDTAGLEAKLAEMQSQLNRLESLLKAALPAASSSTN